MHSFELPPRIRLLNHLLLIYLVLNLLALVGLAVREPLLLLLLPVQLALGIGVFFKRPLAYLVLMGLAFLGLVLALHGAQLIAAAFSALALWLAFLIRSNLYLRRSDVEAAAQVPVR